MEKIYVVSRERVKSKKENIEKWWNNNFNESLITMSYTDNLACFRSFDQAKNFAYGDIEKQIRIYEVREHDINVYVEPIKMKSNLFELGNIAYTYIDDMYIVYYRIDEMELD